MRMLICLAAMLLCLNLSATATPVYQNGRLESFQISNGVTTCNGYVIVPLGAVDKLRRWIWISPGWMAIMKNPPPAPTGAGPDDSVEHQWYIERVLAQGFHVAVLETGTMLGSPAGADMYQRLYTKVTHDYGLYWKARLLGQSNGGLMVYAWAFRHPRCVDRILGLYPATDFTSWPGLNLVVGPNAITPPGLGFNMTLEELQAHIHELNPIDNFEPLVVAGAKIYHLHGDLDTTVPIDLNSLEYARRYTACSGRIEIGVVQGVGHSPGPSFYQNQKALDFLLAN